MMPKRKDIHKIMVIGSGPIVIGQACEFDYSGSQACKALKEEGYEVVLINSNPATIMTDPEMASKIYIEPLTSQFVQKIIEREKPDALLPTLGGQTALNIAAELAEKDVLTKYNVELIGAKFEAIRKAEDRILFKKSMERIQVPTPRSASAYSVEEAIKIADELEYPVIIRPAYTLGGTGGGIAYNKEELKRIALRGINNSRIGQVLIEESLIGWKEYELEVMRDLADNVIIICSIENMDPMGIHTGDSITCAPAQTLTDREYQVLRDAAIKIIREIGVETGGSNVQFAVHPENGRFVAIEINPRVSRSSALASKATGFPIAKIAAKLAIGLTLDEIPNDITKETFASFEPTIDYVVVKIPRWPFDKFPDAENTLTTQMKSVGEVMAIGRTFEEALQKAIRSLEIGRHGLNAEKKALSNIDDIDVLKKYLKIPTHERIFHIQNAIKRGMSIDEIYELTKVDKWFLYKIKNIVKMEEKIKEYTVKTLPKELLRKAKQLGFSDRQLAYLLNTDELTIRRLRKAMGIIPTYKLVDTCAAEFEAKTPYYYSCYEEEDEVKKTKRKKIMIIGSGPNRIGQGIEFDYCCVHAAFASKEEGYEVIMVNCNPETVSTDYDTSDRLYFEPVTFEDVMNIIEKEKPEGIILQFGGQTPLNLAIPLSRQGVPILGTLSKDIDKAEDREKFSELLRKLKIPQADYGFAFSVEDAKKVARKLGYPVLVRPSYVLGGRAMEIVYDERSLEKHITEAIKVSPEYPILIDKFLEDSVEVEVDALCDRKDVFIGGVMEHVERAGIHSGDSACVLPPYSINAETIETIKEYTRKIALELNVVGLINIQFAVKDGKVYVLEANPRASRTVPYLSKASGIPLAKIATKLILGHTLRGIGFKKDVEINHVAVKEAVFPFVKLLGVDTVLGPEMKATGEVMGIDTDFGLAYYKSQISAGTNLPSGGNVFISVKDEDKPLIIQVAKRLKELGFNILTTRGTSEVLINSGVNVKILPKVHEDRPNVIDHMKSGKIDLIINTPGGKGSKDDEFQIRRVAVESNIPYVTTITGALAVVKGIERIKKGNLTVKSIQEYHKESYMLNLLSSSTSQVMK
jgi:carbamoyl-phosphate synthase large subunit